MLIRRKNRDIFSIFFNMKVYGVSCFEYDEMQKIKLKLITHYGSFVLERSVINVEVEGGGGKRSGGV